LLYNFAIDTVAIMPHAEAPHTVSRTFIATFIALLAVCVAGYTAYMQRQQVRAAVWPILEFDSSNGPDIHFSLFNKGVGPAIIRHVIVKVDDQPATNWNEVLDKLVGPGKHRYSESDMSGHVLAPNESMTVFIPHDPEGNALTDRSNPLWVEMNKDRERLSIEICYSSTLGECWILRASGLAAGMTTETSRCPRPSEITFQQ
jgi:hypothetical protein